MTCHFRVSFHAQFTPTKATMTMQERWWLSPGVNLWITIWLWRERRSVSWKSFVAGFYSFHIQPKEIMKLRLHNNRRIVRINWRSTWSFSLFCFALANPRAFQLSFSVFHQQTRTAATIPRSAVSDRCTWSIHTATRFAFLMTITSIACSTWNVSILCAPFHRRVPAANWDLALNSTRWPRSSMATRFMVSTKSLRESCGPVSVDCWEWIRSSPNMAWRICCP